LAAVPSWKYSTTRPAGQEEPDFQNAQDGARRLDHEDEGDDRTDRANDDDAGAVDDHVAKSTKP